MTSCLKKSCPFGFTGEWTDYLSKSITITQGIINIYFIERYQQMLYHEKLLVSFSLKINYYFSHKYLSFKFLKYVTSAVQYKTTFECSSLVSWICRKLLCSCNRTCRAFVLKHSCIRSKACFPLYEWNYHRFLDCRDSRGSMPHAEI